MAIPIKYSFTIWTEKIYRILGLDVREHHETQNLDSDITNFPSTKLKVATRNQHPKSYPNLKSNKIVNILNPKCS